METVKKSTVKKATPSLKKEGVAPKAVKQSDIVKVENISNRQINTSKGTIAIGGKGEATVAELRQYSKFLKRL